MRKKKISIVQCLLSSVIQSVNWMLFLLYRSFIFIKNTQIFPSSVLNLFNLCLTQIITKKCHHIYSIARSASMRLSVLNRFRQFFIPAELLTKCEGLVRFCLDYAAHVLRISTHTAVLDRVKDFSSHKLPFFIAYL